MRNFQIAVALLALSGMGLAAAAPPDGEPAVTKSTKHHAAKPVKKDETAEKLRQLKEMIDQQQAAMQQMQQQLQDTQQQLKQTQQQLSQTQQTAQQADAKVATVETNSNLQVEKVQSDLSDVKTALNTTALVAQKAEKKAEELEHPYAISYKGIHITPGGFFDLSSVYRGHATNTSQATPYNSIPLGNSLAGVGGLSEFSATARGTRISLRADADTGQTKLTGYFEGDFYAIAVASPNQTTSWPFRIRQGWGRAKFANGWSVTGGQMWNLITMNRRAADSDAPWIPNTIDTNYLVGYDWGRQAELRIAKNFQKDFTFALALTDPSYLSSTNNLNTQVSGLATAVPIGGAGGNLGNSYVNGCSIVAATTVGGTPTVACTASPTYSTNLAPDIIVKLAYDNPKLGHYEIKGVQRFFRDRLATIPAAGSTPAIPGWNNTALGGGVGAGAIVPVVARKVDFIAQGMYGKGISRYQDSGQYDFVVRTNIGSNGTPITGVNRGDDNLQAIKTFSVVAGVETHPTPKVELNLFFGDEYYYKSLYSLTSTTAGAAPVPEGFGLTNAGNNRNIAEGSAVVWYDVYRGVFGTLRYGAQYEYIERGVWDRSPAESTPGSFKGVDNIGQLSMRYILP